MTRLYQQCDNTEGEPRNNGAIYDYLFQCDVGFAGDGVKCGVDGDHDGTPDDAIPECNSPRCKAVSSL